MKNHVKKFVLNLSGRSLVKAFKVLIFLPLATFSFSANSSQLESNFVVAKVNSKVITNLELIDRYQFVLAASKIKIRDNWDRNLLLNQVLDRMIDEELIRQEAQNLKIEISQDEIRDAIEILALQQKKNSTQFKFFFINNGLSFDNYLRQVESELMWSKIIAENLRSKVKISDTEVKEFFEQRRFNTDVKKFYIAEIVIFQSESAEQLANKLVLELKNGADFKNIVRQFSQSISSENDGELGWVSQNEMDQKIYAAILKLTKNGYSNPVLLSDGYHIFKLIDEKVETKVADHDLNSARNAIFVKKMQTVSKGYLMDLRKKAFVEKKL